MFLEKNRDRIEKDFEDFSRELPGKAEEIKKRMEALSPDIVIGMKYLYSNMPYSDVGNYTTGNQSLVCGRSDVPGNGHAYRLRTGNLQKRCRPLW